MRLQRLLLLTGTIIVSLLAAAGFATFSTDGENPVPSGTDHGSVAGFAAGGYMAGVGRVVETPIETAPVGEDAAATTASSSGPIQRSSYLTERDVRRLVALYFEPVDVDRAVRISWCESTFNAGSLDPGDGGAGLFHLSPAGWADLAASAGWSGADIFDPEANVAAAAWLVYQGPSGWASFNCQG
jgi:hypothetical protein